MKAVAASARKNITSQSMQSISISAGRCKPIPEVAAPLNKISQITLLYMQAVLPNTVHQKCTK